MAKRYELNEQLWARIVEMEKSDPGRTAKDNRLFVNGVLWVLRSGAEWDELPERYGCWMAGGSRPPVISSRGGLSADSKTPGCAM